MVDEPTERDPQWLRGVLPLLVLSILRRGECYGYDLSRQLAAAGVGAVKGGTLYPILSRLERDALVEIHWSETRGGPARKYYRLTATGREQLAHGAEAWLAFAEAAKRILEPTTTGGA